MGTRPRTQGLRILAAVVLVAWFFTWLWFDGSNRELCEWYGARYVGTDLALDGWCEIQRAVVPLWSLSYLPYP